MKKVLFSLLVVIGMLFAGDTANAQTKIGVFDLDIMVQAMPGYRAVDSLLQIYQRDSLAAEYAFYESEYKRLDSTYKLDSAAKKPNNVLDLEKQQRQQVAINLVYWQQISQNKTEQKKGILAQPLYEKVAGAYKRVLDARKYDLILKPNTFELGSKVENVFIFVAKDLKITLPQELGGGAPEPADEPATPATKPATGAKKPGAKG